MGEEKCATCGGPLESGFVSTTNGSGIYWAQQATNSRLRPTGLEVLVGTGFMGTYSANLPGGRCPTCQTVLVRLK